MKVRGERECRSCGTRWSYYETGSVACPACGSLRSVGVDSRTAHTDTPVTLDLRAHRARFGDARGVLPEEGVDDLKADLRAYLRRRGFINGGRLAPLDTTYLTARELLEAVDAYDRLRDPTDDDRAYLLALLAGTEEGDRPETTVVPANLREARGMAAVHAVTAYREDLTTFLDELAAAGDGDRDGYDDDTADGEGDETADGEGDETADGEGDDTADGEGDDTADGDDGSPVVVEGTDPIARVRPARDRSETLRDRIKRADALGGDIDPVLADALVDAANALGEFVRTGDDATLERVDDLLETGPHGSADDPHR